ncbi:LAFA_0G00320g1_1 [Lachancea sp. 'fantastica']|nr:LAFA_0G00320g1_1 [Lachancea sp. 'fantastica']
MDLIDHLSVKKPLTTGLAKRLESIEQDDSFNLGGTGFLFNNNSVFKNVRDRLYGNEKDNEKAQDDFENGSEDDIIAPTQKITLAYDGENLEQDFPKQRESIEFTRENHSHQRELSKHRNIGVTSANNEATQIVQQQPDTIGDEGSNQVLETQIMPEDSPDIFTDDDFELTKRDLTQSNHELESGGSALKATVQDVNAALPLNANELLPHDGEEGERHEFSPKESEAVRDSDDFQQIPAAGTKFTTRDFVNGFDDVSDSDEDAINLNNESAIATSQADGDRIEVQTKKFLNSSSGSQSTIQLRSLKVYQGTLRQQLQEKEVVALSSSSDEETATGADLKGSKAAVFDLKARLSKRRQNSKMSNSKSSSASASLKTLFHTLRKANKEQIMDYRKGKLALNGIDFAAIADEKESVESLLDRELARNKRIRQRELQREKEKGASKDNDDAMSSDLDFSNNEFEGEDSDENNSDLDRDPEDIHTTNNDAIDGNQDLHESSAKKVEADITEGTEINETAFDGDLELAKGHHDEKNNTGRVSSTAFEGRQENKGGNESQSQEKEGGEEDEEEEEEEEEEGEEEEEEEGIQLSRKSRRRQLEEFESDNENLQRRSTENVIDLGAYGDNISHSIADTSHQSAELLAPRRSSFSETENGDRSSLTAKTHEQAEQDTELLRARIQKIIERRKNREAKRAIRMHKLRHSKANEMMEMEAEESEDEWYGVGGHDGEASEDHDSELEAMIDDYSHSNSNSDEIRQKLIEEDINKDKDLVNKILHDIESGGFRKRGRGALDLELSDEEDDELLKYHARRKKEFRQKLSLGALGGTAIANPKAKPFFECAVEDLDEKTNFLSEDEFENKKTDIEQTPQEASRAPKKRTTLSEAFVQETLSFLTSRDKEPHLLESEVATSSHARDGEDDEELDLHSLKQRSTIKIFSNASIELNATSGDDFEQAAFEKKAGSIFSRFKHHKEASEMFKEGQKTVKSAKTYKVAGSSRASITYLGRARKLTTGKKAIKLRSKAIRRKHPSDPLPGARNEGGFET